MVKYIVKYMSGQSRHSDKVCDFMLANVDGVELYAETPSHGVTEIGTYDDLKAEIIAQAEEAGVNINCLEFWYG